MKKTNALSVQTMLVASSLLLSAGASWAVPATGWMPDAFGSRVEEQNDNGFKIEDELWDDDRWSLVDFDKQKGLDVTGNLLTSAAETLAHAGGKCVEYAKCIGKTCARGARSCLVAAKQELTGEARQRRSRQMLLLLKDALANARRGEKPNADLLASLVRREIEKEWASADAVTQDGVTAVQLARELTALHYDAFEAVLDVLIEKRANVYVQDEDGNTALHNAIREGCRPCVWLLVPAMAEPKFRCTRTICERISLGMYNSYPLSIRNEDGQTPMSLAVEKNDLATVNSLLAFKNRMTKADKSKAVVSAFIKSNEKITSALNEVGVVNWKDLVDLIERERNKKGKLKPVVYKMLVNRFLDFVESGALDPNKVDNVTGNTLAHETVLRRNKRPLIVMVREFFSRKPVEERWYETVDTLRFSTNESIMVRNRANKTVLDLSVAARDVDFVKCLGKQHGATLQKPAHLKLFALPIRNKAKEDERRSLLLNLNGTEDQLQDLQSLIRFNKKVVRALYNIATAK